MRDMDRLTGFTFSADGNAPHMPFVRSGDRIARIPEFRRQPAVTDIFDHIRDLSVLDLPCDLRRELEIEPLVIDAVGFDGFHVQSVIDF